MILYAGEIYLEKFGNTKLEEAGECFSRAGDYRHAALVYAKGNLISMCLVACIKGKLYEEGLNYIYMSREQTTPNKNDTEKIAQKLLTTAAKKYKKLVDSNTMMRFVKAFQSKSSMHDFLKSEGCLEELLDLEIERGNFLFAANIANQLGRLQCEAELLEKANQFKEASLSILYYVFSNSLWSSGGKGWPLKGFAEKEKLLCKAKALAEKVSDQFSNDICTEVDVLSRKSFGLSELNRLFLQSRSHRSVRGVIISARKILDDHFCKGHSAYICEDLSEQAENFFGSNRVSIETLIYFWNMWKLYIDGIFQYLCDLKDNDDYGHFCLNYLGLTKSNANEKTIYTLLYSGSSWVKDDSVECLDWKGKFFYLKEGQFVKAAESYWRSEMLSVGKTVLKKLKNLFEFHRNMNCKCICLTHMFEVAKALEESEYLELSTDNFIEKIFPLNWQFSSPQIMINLKEKLNSRNLLKNAISRIINSKDQLTHKQIGNVVTIVLGSSYILSDELYEGITIIMKDKKSAWKLCIESLLGPLSSKFPMSPVYHVSMVHKFFIAMQETFYVDRVNEKDYMSPWTFMYLLERLMVMVLLSKETFFCTRSYLLEWLLHNNWNKNTNIEIVDDWESWFSGIFDFFAKVLEELLCNEKKFLSWVEKFKLSLECQNQLVVRLFVLLCLLCVNSRSDLFQKLLNDRKIITRLPSAFWIPIQKWKPGNLEDEFVILAEVFRRNENPLVVVSSEEHISKSKDTIYVNLKTHIGRNSFMGKLFNIPSFHSYR